MIYAIFCPDKVLTLEYFLGGGIVCRKAGGIGPQHWGAGPRCCPAECSHSAAGRRRAAPPAARPARRRRAAAAQPASGAGALRMRGSCRRVRRVCSAAPSPSAPRRHAGLPAAGGAAEVPASDHGSGRVGGRRGASERSDGALPVLPCGRRRGSAGRAGRPGGHGAAAACRRVPR